MFAPAGTIVPDDVLPPTTPSASQERTTPGATQSAAVKVCMLPAATFADAGAIEFAPAQEIVTVAEADFELSATLATATETGAPGGILGAV